MIKKMLVAFALLAFASNFAFSATRIVTADQIISSDLSKSFTFPPSSDQLCGNSTASAFTNKTIDCSLNTCSNLPAPSFGGTTSDYVRGDSSVAVFSTAVTGVALSLNGGTMNGGLDMGNNSITNLQSPVAGGDAVNKNYVNNNFLQLAGGTMSGTLSLGSHRITNVTDPSSAQDASTKNYTDALKSVFVYKPGGTASGNVYSSWASLYTALTAATGVRTVYVDDSVTSPATIPAGSYDVTNVIFSGSQTANTSTQLQVNNGVTFTGFYSAVGNLFITFLNTSVVETISSPRAIFLDNAGIAVGGSSPIFAINSDQVDWFLFNQSSISGSGATPAIAISSTFSQNFTLAGHSSIGINMVSGDGTTSILTNFIDAASSVSNQSGFTGSLSSMNLEVATKVRYSPAVPGDWSPAPTNVASALDQLAAAGGGGLVNVIDGPNFSAIEGDVVNNVASGQYSFAEGESTTAQAEASHAEGRGPTASGFASHAEGNFTTASGNYAHAEGSSTRATGEGAHSEGTDTRAENKGAHAQGNQSKAVLRGQMAQASGQFNNPGDAQFTRTTMRISTTDATPTILTITGNPYPDEGFVTETGKVYACISHLIAKSLGGSDVSQMIRRFVVNNNAGLTSLVGSVQTVGTDITTAGAAGWSHTITVGGSPSEIQFTVTGDVATTIQWFVSIECSETMF